MCEVEHMSFASAMQECIDLEQLLKNVDKYQNTQTKVFEDNQGTIALAENPVHRQRCKHIDINYHFMRETINSGRVVLESCPTDQMVADLLTKPATKMKLKSFAQDMFCTEKCSVCLCLHETMLLVFYYSVFEWHFICGNSES